MLLILPHLANSTCFAQSSCSWAHVTYISILSQLYLHYTKQISHSRVTLTATFRQLYLLYANSPSQPHISPTATLRQLYLLVTNSCSQPHVTHNATLKQHYLLYSKQLFLTPCNSYCQIKLCLPALHKAAVLGHMFLLLLP